MSGALVLGIDEAGYGPKLGPLVVGSVALRGPEALASEACAPAWALLHDGCIAAAPRADDGARLLAGDSKAIHKPAKGSGPLEEQVLAFLAAAWSGAPTTLGELWLGLGVAVDARPWGASADTPLPRRADPARIAVRGERLAAACSTAGVEIAQVRVACVHPAEFNSGIAMHGNKSVALFHWVAPLLRDAWTIDAGGRRLALLDKEGGRDRYLGLVMQALPDVRVEGRLEEGRARSRYLLDLGDVRCTMLVEPKGERHLPVALASMVAKYVRELAMESWNAFWVERVPGLKPTAGYPQDANRFLAAIAPVRDSMDIPPDDMVRGR